MCKIFISTIYGWRFASCRNYCHLVWYYFLLFALAACSSEEAPPSEEAEAKEQTVNAQPKENLDLLNVDRGLAIHK
ncbi:hypothetical protein OL548_21185 [Lysinibacillus sp. MHQ-1]|nr:hypothetical protein OL548_21185 [Lysinibacillus sp. MHQ-1]